MTTHELARLLEHLGQGLGPALTKKATDDLAVAATALRELPEQGLKDLVKGLQKQAAPPGGAGVDGLFARIQACRGKGGDAVAQAIKEVNKLKQAELQQLVRLLGRDPGKNKVPENKTLIRTILETPAAAPPAPADGSAVTSSLGSSAEAVDSGVRLFTSLRDTQGLSINDLRVRFAPLREQPKAVLEEIARRMGYEFSGSKEDVAEQLLQTLERMRVSQIRGDIIKGTPAAQDTGTTAP